MTKEDYYMFLPKERLAELLAERDKRQHIYVPLEHFTTTPCYSPNCVCNKTE